MLNDISNKRYSQTNCHDKLCCQFRKYPVTITVNAKNKGIIKAELLSLQNVKE